jgi:maltooligosyltrehalose trehalohydrolase
MRGGYGMDAVWNDDFHHAARVALTGRGEGYLSDYRGSVQEFISAAKWGYLFQGQLYRWQRKRRGTPAFDVPPRCFVNYLENHDQVANSIRGERLHRLASPGRYRALTALLLLGPGTPLLFQGQEFGATAPFTFFADLGPDLSDSVRRGRARFLSQFRSLTDPAARTALPDPCSERTFQRCKVNHTERQQHPESIALHKDLLRLRREDAVFSNPQPRGMDGAVLGEHGFVLRFFGKDGDDRLLLINLDVDLMLPSVPEPLLAPPRSRGWRLIWSSDDVRYGGSGIPPIDPLEGWFIPGEAAVVLAASEADDHEK